MKVGLDAHTLRGRFQGIRTYIGHVARELIRQASSDDRVALIGCSADEARQYVSGTQWDAHRWFIRSPWLRIPLEAPLRELTLGLNVLHTQYICPPASFVPQVVTIHDILFELHPEWFAPSFVWRSRALYRWSARRASVIITGSQYSRDALVDVYRVPAERIKVIPYGVDHVLWQHSELSAGHPGSAHGRPRAIPPRFHLFVGRIDPRKNLETLVAAYRLLSEQKADIPPLLIVGPRDYGSERIIAAIADDLRAGRAVEVGPVDDATLQVLFRSAEVVVFPTLGEGFGLPVLEAMAVGATVVTTACPSIREFADGCVVYGDPHSAPDLARAIAEAAAGGEAVRQLRDRAVARAAQYTWHEVGRRLWDVYRQLD